MALDERRRNRENSAGLPLEELLECRLSGIDVCDVQAFIEREAGKLDIELLQPSWMVFSDGFIRGTWRTATEAHIRRCRESRTAVLRVAVHAAGGARDLGRKRLQRAHPVSPAARRSRTVATLP